MDKEEAIIEAFPKLSDDPDFKITSPDTPNYNCIAWAYHFNDRWMWPGGEECKTLDGFHYWPNGIESTDDVSSFVDAFQLKGYQICHQWEHEDGFQKIALYVTPGTTKCTHASRELRSGKWTSKLGKCHDIQHGTPYTIEGDMYGVVFCIMKHLFDER